MVETKEVSAAPPAAKRRYAPRTPQLGSRIKFGEPLYNEVHDFLIEETFLLDEDRLGDWMAVLTDDVLYTMPVRQTRYRRDGRGFEPSMNWLYEDIASIRFKIERMMETDSAFAEDPPSRTRRLITNVRVHETDVDGEFWVQSSVLLRRNRGDAHVSDEISARRDDIVRRVDGGWKLAQRKVFMDQTVLGTPNMAVFF